MALSLGFRRVLIVWLILTWQNRTRYVDEKMANLWNLVKINRGTIKTAQIYLEQLSNKNGSDNIKKNVLQECVQSFVGSLWFGINVS